MKKEAQGREQVHELQVNTSCGKGSLKLCQKGRVFHVLDLWVPGHEDLSMAFSLKGNGVVDLDQTSDIAQVKGLSTRAQYDNVILDTLQMRANSIEELTYALGKVEIVCFNPEDI